jgi:phosphonate degradation associated HDIG domain protein
MTDILAVIDRLFAARGADEYHGEAVTQLEHALQAALLAERAGASAELITGALLHDVGHLLHGHGEAAAGRGIDDRHEALGERFLRPHFGPIVTEPVRLHVPAKRYLCAADPAYRTTLSPASVRSLELQGGPMSPAGAAEFARGPHAAAAVALRRWDDAAKVVGHPTPPLAHFRRYLRAGLRQRPVDATRGADATPLEQA